MSYQHLGGYLEGDKVWYQPFNGNTWFGPAAVLCQGGQSVWLHSHGVIRKVAACRVKPYELIYREMAKIEEIYVKKQVILEDGLDDVENLLTDSDKDSICAKYLKMSNSVSFPDMCTYVIQLTVSEH